MTLSLREYKCQVELDRLYHERLIHEYELKSALERIEDLKGAMREVSNRIDAFRCDTIPGIYADHLKKPIEEVL